MNSAMSRMGSGPMESWSFAAWDAAAHVVAEEFSLDGVLVDLQGSSISFHLWGDEAYYTPAGRWSVDFRRISSCDLTFFGGTQEPQSVSTTIQEHPNYALLGEATTAHLVADFVSLVEAPSVPQVEPGNLLAWVVDGKTRRVHLLDQNAHASAARFPWDFDIDLIYVRPAERTVSFRLKEHVPADEAVAEGGNWLVLEDVETLVAVSRAGGSTGNYVEEILSDGKTVYLRLGNFVIHVTTPSLAGGGV